jgi:hypothetical protein
MLWLGAGLPDLAGGPASVYRRRQPHPDRQRCGPAGALSDPMLTAEIQAVLVAAVQKHTGFHGFSSAPA